MTDRQFTTALYILRCLQVGLRLPDLKYLETGDVMDIITESANDDYNWPRLATQADFDRF